MLNLFSFWIYFSITVPLIIYIGWKCFTLGKVFLLDLLKDEEICHTVNRILLTGYYLLNIGYVAVSVSIWKKIDSLEVLIPLVFYKISIILLIIGIVHCFNIAAIYYLKKNIISTLKH